MAAGVTSDATDIMIYDDTHADAGGDGSYSFADIFAILGGTGVDILRVDSGTGFPTYRLLKNLQIGDKTTNAAATTLSDTNVSLTFDLGKVLKARATQTSSWSCLFGTKIGTGNQAIGKNGVHLFFTNTAGTNNVILRGTSKWYGCTARSSWSAGIQAFQMITLVNGACELINCTLGGFSSYVFGTAAGTISNLYNLDITGESTATGNITSFFVDSAERNSIGGSPTTSHIASASASLTIKNQTFFGTPGSSDMRWVAPTGTNWIMVSPKWSGANKFSGTGPSSASIGAQEYWPWGVKAVDRNGVGVSGIPITLTDTNGTEQVNTTTDANGETSYGSGITANCAVAADHWSTTLGVYTISHRSPFTVRVNQGAGANPNYLSRTYKFYWPGYSSVTTNSGTFLETYDIVPVEEQSGGLTTWTECSIP